MQLKDAVVVLTGGGSGIGRELSLQLLAKGARVAIADVNETAMRETQKLAEKYGDRFSTHKLDISNKEAVFAFPQTVIEAHGTVDVLINNAGIIQPFVSVDKLTDEQIERIMNINFYGTLYMVRAFLPHLLKRPKAHITNVASMGGFIPFPGQTIYSASKAAVKLLTEGLYAELMDSEVNVSLIYPGAVKTNITANSGIETTIDEVKQSKFPMLSADQAARMIIEATEKDKPRLVAGKDARMLDFIYRLNPTWAIGFISKKMRAMGI